jgi:hypothetical protein
VATILCRLALAVLLLANTMAWAMGIAHLWIQNLRLDYVPESMAVTAFSIALPVNAALAYATRALLRSLM